MKNKKEIQIADIWNNEKTDKLKNYIRTKSNEQSEERKVRNEMLAIQYQIEDYIQSENPANKLRLIDFVKMYLKILNVTQKKLATLFEMKDSNLHKYLVGERKLNTSLVLKLSTFSHTNPEYWLRVEVKNELIDIIKEKEKTNDYQKYDYKHLLTTTG